MQDIDNDKTENFLKNNDFYVNELYKKLRHPVFLNEWLLNLNDLNFNTYKLPHV